MLHSNKFTNKHICFYNLLLYVYSYMNIKLDEILYVYKIADKLLYN